MLTAVDSANTTTATAAAAAAPISAFLFVIIRNVSGSNANSPDSLQTKVRRSSKKGPEALKPATLKS